MRLRGVAPLLLLAAAAVAPTAALARYEGNVNFFLGQKWLNTADWSPVDEQPELGVMLAFAPERSRVYFALDVLASRKSATTTSSIHGTLEVTGETREYDVGVRKVWKVGATHPFLGAGGCLIVSRVSVSSPTYSPSYGDEDYGVWVDGGVTWRIGDHFNLGFDLRVSTAHGTFDSSSPPVNVEVGGFHAGLLLGYGW
jgi:hypothetical protein